ncbi:hypothetical protein EV122DRAFT_277859 [Schizophyllum commune]
MSGSPKKRKKKTPHPRTAPAGGSEGAAACAETTHIKVKRRTKATQSAPTIGDPGHKSAFEKRVDEWSRYMHALTPKSRTRTCRSEAMKDKVYALVGRDRASCLLTGLKFHPHFLQVAHIIPRSLPDEHEAEYKALANDVGMLVVNGRGKSEGKYINLDSSFNQEILVAWMHMLFDGISVKKSIGRGAIVLVPENFDQILDLIRNNKGKLNYRELIPGRLFRYKLRCLSNCGYFYARFADALRTYSHLNEELLQQIEKEDSMLDMDENPFLDNDYRAQESATCAVDPKDFLRNLQERSNGPCEPRALDVGDEEETIVSHIHPVAATWHLAVSMNYRMSQADLRAQLLPEWRRHYHSRLRPSTKQWFPSAKDDDDEDDDAEETANDVPQAPGEHHAEESSEVHTNEVDSQFHLLRPCELSSEPPSSPTPGGLDNPSLMSPLGGRVNSYNDLGRHSVTVTKSYEDAQGRLRMPELIPAMALRDSSPLAEPAADLSSATQPVGAAEIVNGTIGQTQGVNATTRATRTAKSLADASRSAGTLPKNPPSKKVAKSVPTIASSAHSAASSMPPPPVPERRQATLDRARRSSITKSNTRPAEEQADDDTFDQVALTLEATDEGTNDAREPQATSTAFTAEPPEPPDSLEIPADEAAEPEPPDPPDPPGPRRKKQRPNARNRAEEADVERDHDPPPAARNAPRVRFRDREDGTDVERDHDPPDLSNPPTKKKGRRGRDR